MSTAYAHTPATASALIVLLIQTLAGCGGSDSAERSSVREVRGDTTFVQVPASADPSHHTVTDLVIGTVDGEATSMFAHVSALHIDRRGRIIVLDEMQIAVRRYAADGDYLGDIGRNGRGPGEFAYPRSISTDVEDRILIGDDDRSIHRYRDDGTYLDSWKAPGRIANRSAVVGNNDGTISVTSPVRVGGAESYVRRLYLMTLEGVILDSITPHVPWMAEVESGHMRPGRLYSVGPTGLGITSVGSRLGFQTFRIDAPTMVRVEQEADRPRFVPEERKAWADYAAFVATRSATPDDYPPPPETKPHLRTAVVARTGEIWLVRHQGGREHPNAAETIMGYPAPPHWIEPFLAEVYTSDGEHLATVNGPEDFQLMFASTDTIWGVQRGEFTEQYVVRFTLSRPLRK